MNQNYHEARRSVELALRFARVGRYPTQERVEELLAAERSAWVREFGSKELKELHLRIAPGAVQRTYAEQHSSERQRVLSLYRAKFEAEWVARTHPGWEVQPLNHPEGGKRFLTVSATAELEGSIRGRQTESIHPAVTLVGTPPIDEFLQQARTTVPDAEVAVRNIAFDEGPSPDKLHPYPYAHYALAERRVPGDESPSSIVRSVNEQQRAASQVLYEKRRSPLMRVIQQLELQYGVFATSVPSEAAVAGTLVSVVRTEKDQTHAFVAEPWSRQNPYPRLYALRVPPGEECALQAHVGRDVTVEGTSHGIRIGLRAERSVAREVDPSRGREDLSHRVERVTGRAVCALPDGKVTGRLHSIDAGESGCLAVVVTQSRAHILSIPRELAGQLPVGGNIVVAQGSGRALEPTPRALMVRVPGLER